MRHPRAVAASAATALIMASLASPALAGPDKDRQASAGDRADRISRDFSRTLRVGKVYNHLEAFQDIADDHDGNRAAGTSGYEASARYVERELQFAGYQTERQYFSFERFSVTADTLRQDTPTARELANNVMTYSPSGTVTGRLTPPAGNAQGCDAAAYAGQDLTGQIALVSRGTCSFAVKSLTAAAAGAEAVIVYNNAPGALNGTLGAPDPGYVPSTGITQADGQALLADLASGPVQVTLEIETELEDVETFNILAETPTGRTDNVVMVGAHLDSVDDGPGINDNGSGSAAILETAIQLARGKVLNNQVRFAWWGAEEYGLIGSNHYVADLVENDPDELDAIATYLNFDMVASPNYIIGVYDADESTYPASVPPPPGSIATEAVFTDYFDSVGQPWVDTAYSGRSDYQAFILNGVPASGLFTGADGTKTREEVALFGGVAGVIYDPNYHTPADDLSNVNLRALSIMSRAIGYATMSLGQDTSAVNGRSSSGMSSTGMTSKVHPQDMPDIHHHGEGDAA